MFHDGALLRGNIDSRPTSTPDSPTCAAHFPSFNLSTRLNRRTKSPIFATKPFSAILQRWIAVLEGFEAFPAERRSLDIWEVVGCLPRVALTCGVVILFAWNDLDYLRLNLALIKDESGVDSGVEVGDMPIVWRVSVFTMEDCLIYWLRSATSSQRSGSTIIDTRFV